MVTHMVFTPAFFEGLLSSPRPVGTWVVFCGSSMAAGPFVVSVLDSPCFVLVFLVDDAVAAAGRIKVVSGDSERFPPPSPPGPCDGDATAADDRDVDAAAADNGNGEDDDVDVDLDLGLARSRVHSSLWPARHAALWQAWLQYFRCRHPEQK